eukprot:gnl/Hemi2/3651_TR1274_c0_g1_i1.p1 gnl/Hemi2/3651_TR1274_c0_g1~~gnl/Hemi2/3651_TR1274_c0_g1_i1.p1  ORF type:complete len:168 (+),score=53.79 gnl/Hemi2/3651_TR1274_c0_g1_i1:45-506(+)
MYGRLLSSPAYEHRICGMHPAVAEAVRGGRRVAGEGARVCAAVALRLQNIVTSVHAGASSGVATGSAMGTWDSLSQGDEDVVVYLLSDPTNVDSKQITFVKTALPGPTQMALYAALYKVNFLSDGTPPVIHPPLAAVAEGDDQTSSTTTTTAP